MASKGNTDEKVVQLMLDSKEFDSNAKKSIQTLDDLKKAFEFEGASKGFEEIERAARKVDLSIMENGIQKVQDHFNLLNTIATTALERITNTAIDTGVNLVKSLSTDQIMTGWSKFEDKTSSVQTIMSATSQQFTDVGEQMEFVEGQLERLNWFTDETSFKFLDMVNNIGKFTSNSVDLDVSVKAMQGISTWAARSGANVQEAGRAMYNLSQAIAVGAVKLQDWKSIENANMATAEFKQTAIETAEAMGTLRKVADGVWATLKGKEVSIKNFNENLSEGWFTSEVLLQTLSKYGDFATKLGDLVSETGVQTTVMIGYIEDYIDGTINMDAAIADTGLSAKELIEWLDLLSSEEYKLGRESFKAAQETKTLTEAIDYVKEAVSSGWMRTFEYIFGNYTEAKELWSELAESMYDFFVASGDARNELLALWKEAGGRNLLIKGFKELGKNIVDIFESIQDAWRNIFGKELDEQVEDLLRLTDNFYIFAQSLRITEGSMGDFLRILESVFRMLGTIKRVVSTVIRALEPLARLLNKIGGVALNMIANLLEMFSINIDGLFSSSGLHNLYTMLNTIAKVIEYIGTVALVYLQDGFFGLIAGVDAFWQTFNNTTGGIQGVLEAIIHTLGQFIQGIIEGEGLLSNIVMIFAGSILMLVDLAKDVFNEIIQIFTGQKDANETKFLNVQGWLENIGTVIDSLKLDEKLQAIIDLVRTLSGYVVQLFIDLANADSQIRQTLRMIGVEFKDMWEWFKQMLTSLTIDDLEKIGYFVVIAQLITSMTKLNKAFATATSNFGSVFKTLNDILQGTYADKISTNIEKLKTAFNKTQIMQVGISAILLAAAFNEFNKLDYQKSINSLILMGSCLALLLVVFKKWNKISAEAAKNKKELGLGNENQIGMILLQISAAIFLVANALSTLSSVMGTNKQIGQVIIAAGLLVGAFSGIYFAMTKLGKLDTTNLAKSAASMISVATSMTIMAVPILALSAIPTERLIQGCLAIGGILLAIGILGKLVNKTEWKTMLSIGLAMGSIAAALLLMTGAIAAMSALGAKGESGIAGITEMLIKMSIALAALSGVVSLFKVEKDQLIGLSVAFVSLAGSMVLMGLAAAVLGEANLWDLSIAVGIMAVAIGGLSAALAFVPGAEVMVDKLSKAFISFGVAVALVGTGIAILSTGIAAFTFLIAALGGAALQFGEEFPKMINAGFDAFEIVVGRFLDMIPKYALKIAAAVGTIIAAIKLAIWMQKKGMAQTIVAVGLELISVLITFGDPLIDAFCKLMEILDGRVGDIIDSARPFVEHIFEGLIDLIIAACIGMARGVIGFIDDIFGTSLYRSFERSLGEHAVEGLRQGAYTVNEEGKKEFKKIGRNAINSFKDEVGDHSPWETIMNSLKNAAEAFILGTKESVVPAATTAGVDAGDAIVTSMSTTINTGMQGITNDIDGYLAEIDNKLSGFSGGGRASFSAGRGGLFEGQGKSGRSNVFNPFDIINTTKDLVNNATAAAQEEADDSKDDWFNIGEGLGSSLGSGVGSGAAKEKEKTADEIIKEYADALSTAYSEGSKYLDIRDSQLDMEETLWNLKHKEGETDAEKEAYEIAKKQFEIDQLNTQMQNKLDRLALLNAQYIDKLNLYGSGASETVEAFNSLISGRLELLSMYNEKMDLLATEVEHDPEAFIAASNEISEWRELVEKGFITNEQMMEAAKDKIGKVVGAQQHEFENTNTELDKKLEALIEGTEQVSDLAGEAWDQLTTDSLKGAIDNLGEGAENLTWAMTDTIGRALQQVVTDGTVFKAADGLGVNINDGTVNGMETTKKTLFGTAESISKETIDTMADTLGVHSPSTITTEFGKELDNGLINGIRNRQAAVIEQAVQTAAAALAAAKKTLGISSPSKETYAMGNYFDRGLANGISDNSKVITKSIYGMVNNLLDTTNSQLAQNGSKTNGFLRDLFDLPDDDMHLRVVVDTDDTSLNESMSLLERAYAVEAKAPAFASVNAFEPATVSALDNFDNSTLQGMYDLLSSYIDFQKEQASKKEETDKKTVPVNMVFNQTNTSPKPISATDTYRNTQKQLNMFAKKISTK